MTSGNEASLGDHADMAGLLMQTLGDEDKARAENHLAGCEQCRDEIDSLRTWSDALAAVPEPMRMDGPPDGGDLLLQRALRKVRAESTGFRRRRTALIGVAAAVAAVAAFGAGAVVRPSGVPGDAVAQNASSRPEARLAETTDPATSARMRLAVAPAAGWVRLHAVVSGIPAGERCRLEVIDRGGATLVAGSWVVSAAGESEGTSLDGSALVDPAQVTAVRVVNEQGRVFVRVTL
ncbi:anti-sigma factor [Actinoplanes sp. TRM 88003]|uniref:Anti-sigma factor n=1 Tax=Paractinoplanes aksuensis TaxID=2939490 RepID=A0ABT1DXF1_9ACTN|nr:anti-sigma factor [Actinoplanes aksuensis]MCO8275536.1 anti-sigma factor [Actinoplanes aksuensis]